MVKLPDWWNSDKPYKIMDSIDMKNIPNNSVDLILTDPPYGVNIASEGFIGGGNLAKSRDYGCCEWDRKRIDKKYFDEMFRISKNQIIFGGNYYTDYLPSSSCWVVWDKGRRNTNFADCELSWTSFKEPSRMFSYLWDGMRQEDMKNKEKRVHPTQKPVALFKWILENYSKEGDIILDPFLGSGTTLRACRLTNRIGLGYEINPDEDVIKKRIKLHERRFNEEEDIW